MMTAKFTCYQPGDDGQTPKIVYGFTVGSDGKRSEFSLEQTDGQWRITFVR